MPDLTVLLIAGAAVLLGSAVQSSVGLGLGLVAAPVIALLDPALLPGSMLLVATVLPLLTVGSELRHVDWRGVGWAGPGRIAGTVVGVWVVAVLPPALLGAAVGVMVLVAVALTLRAVRLSPTPATLTAAGFASGAAGTATSIGGPPMALVYQHESGPRVRATLGIYFIFGAALSLAGLAVGGQLDSAQVGAGLALIPFVLAGFLTARPLRRIVDGGKLRAALLAVVTVSGLALLAQPFL